MATETTSSRVSARARSQRGMTLLEVMVALTILATTATPLLTSLASSHRSVTDGNVKRKMKQLMEYKLAHVLLDRPGEGQEPIYVDGWEANFGEEFETAAAEDISYFVGDERLYFYSYRIDSEEIDLGASGGVTGEEEELENSRSDPGGSALGGIGAEAEEGVEESLGQLRYLVTLTVFYDPGSAKYARSMSIVTYVRHPFESERMSGPDLGPGGEGPGALGSGEAGVGASQDPTGGVNNVTTEGRASTQTSSGERDDR